MKKYFALFFMLFFIYSPIHSEIKYENKLYLFFNFSFTGNKSLIYLPSIGVMFIQEEHSVVDDYESTRVYGIGLEYGIAFSKNAILNNIRIPFKFSAAGDVYPTMSLFSSVGFYFNSNNFNPYIELGLGLGGLLYFNFDFSFRLLLDNYVVNKNKNYNLNHGKFIGGFSLGIPFKKVDN